MKEYITCVYLVENTLQLVIHTLVRALVLYLAHMSSDSRLIVDCSNVVPGVQVYTNLFLYIFIYFY